MGMKYTDTVVTGSGPKGTALSLTVAMCDSTTGPQLTHGRWYDCVICGLAFPRNKVMLYKGRAYGIPCTDYKDIEQLARKKE